MLPSCKVFMCYGFVVTENDRFRTLLNRYIRKSAKLLSDMPPGCKAQRRFAHALFVVAAGPCPLLCPVPYTRLSPCRRGKDSHNRLRQSRGEMHIPQKFLPGSRQKLLRSAPGQSFPVVTVMPLAAKVLKRVMVNTGGNKRQVPAKRQNRGSRNSTGDGG